MCFRYQAWEHYAGQCPNESNNNSNRQGTELMKIGRDFNEGSGDIPRDWILLMLVPWKIFLLIAACYREFLRVMSHKAHK